jgi:hypothetical protein
VSLWRRLGGGCHPEEYEAEDHEDGTCNFFSSQNLEKVVGVLPAHIFSNCCIHLFSCACQLSKGNGATVFRPTANMELSVVICGHSIPQTRGSVHFA